jgi:FkbM family methyltransferase
MHFGLVMVGAHDGSKMEQLIRASSAAGKVLLIEPVPFLFTRLTSRYCDVPNIGLLNIAIAKEAGDVEFIAPKETAISITPYGDQLGSLIVGHAIAHDQRFSEHTEVITAKALTFERLADVEHISSIELLFMDTEGMDAELLPTFPFSKILPNRIIFEFKHADGFFRVGPKLASLLNVLDLWGYRVSPMDAENMAATRILKE